MCAHSCLIRWQNWKPLSTPQVTFGGFFVTNLRNIYIYIVSLNQSLFLTSPCKIPHLNPIESKTPHAKVQQCNPNPQPRISRLHSPDTATEVNYKSVPNHPPRNYFAWQSFPVQDTETPMSQDNSVPTPNTIDYMASSPCTVPAAPSDWSLGYARNWRDEKTRTTHRYWSLHIEVSSQHTTNFCRRKDRYCNFERGSIVRKS